MFDHVTLRVSDRAASERFYTTVLPTLDIRPSFRDQSFAEWDDFSLAEARAGEPVTRRLHIAFVAPSRAHVDAFWRAGTAEGYRDDGAPGPRPRYRDDYYGAFLLDPDGNSAEAVHLAFGVGDDAAVDAFHSAATAAGHRDNGAPGERAAYHPSYYSAYVLDPSGHNVEVVNHHR